MIEKASVQAMIPYTPAVRYLVRQLIAGLRDQVLSEHEPVPRPEKVAEWELRAALAIVTKELRAEFESLGSRVTCDPDLRRQLDAYVDQALTRIEAAPFLFRSTNMISPSGH
jgi:hypothetical protein